jgi:hypothetical protein
LSHHIRPRHTRPRLSPPRLIPGHLHAAIAAIAAIVNTLQTHPEFTPFVLEFLETLVQEQVAGVI